MSSGEAGLLATSTVSATTRKVSDMTQSGRPAKTALNWATVKTGP
ncbi:hypothetical protein [Streptomyces tendae]